MSRPNTYTPSTLPVFIEAHFQFELVAAHIPGDVNSLAYGQSRNSLSAFLSKSPHMDLILTPVYTHSAPSIATQPRRLDFTLLDEAVRFTEI